MSGTPFRRWALVSAFAITTSILVWGMVGIDKVFGAERTTFSGRALVVQATVLSLDPITLSDTGPLPSSGGAEHASLLQANVPGLLTADVLHAATVGQGKASRSEASVADLNLSVGGHTVSAGFLMARAAAQCQGGAASVSGSSEVASLVIDGKSITAGTEPNHEVLLFDSVGVPVGKVVINEQDSSVSGGLGDITVNALHVVVYGVADVIISQAHADINCAGPEPGGDFITGGGWITGTPSGLMANFGVAGGIKQGNLWGHLNYIDHGQRLHIRGVTITDYLVLDATTRRIKGTAEINGQSGFTYEVDVADKGEPGLNDTFAIRVSNGYTASGSLEGGNIQLHQ